MGTNYFELCPVGVEGKGDSAKSKDEAVGGGVEFARMRRTEGGVDLRQTWHRRFRIDVQPAVPQRALGLM